MTKDHHQENKSESPQLRIELTYSAVHQKNTIGLLGAEEIITLLEGMQKFLEDHMVLIYLDKNNMIMGIDAFLHNIEELMRVELNRALSRTITHFSSSSRVDHVVIVQVLPKIEYPKKDSILPRMLAMLAAKMLLFDIQTQDIIFVGTKSYFSFQENENAWNLLQKTLQPQLEFLGLKKSLITEAKL